MRAVLDANVLVSAIIASGTPARILASWRSGHFELVVSETLLDELATTLARPRLRERVAAEDASAFIALLREHAHVAVDPRDPPSRCEDPGDDYLFALGEATGSYLVSGDAHVLALGNELPILTPREFLDRLA